MIPPCGSLALSSPSALALVNRISVELPVDLYKISVAHYMLSQNKISFFPGSGDSGDTMHGYFILVHASCSLVPRPSSHGVDP